MAKRILSLLLAVVMLLCLLPGGVRAEAAGKKLIALTFDDGPGPYTARLLDGLAAKGVRATFFTLGNRAKTYSTLIKRIFQEGHQLANHSYSHPQLTALSTANALSQITSTDRALNSVIGGSEAYYLRAPYGSMNSTLRSRIGRPEVFWSVDTLDWKYRDSTYVKNTVINKAFDGAIVLMHDIHPTSVTGVLNAIDSLKSRGYEFVTVRELYRRRGVPVKNGSFLSSCKANGVDIGAAATPTIKVENVAGACRITLSTASTGAAIYYTTDGSAINYSSKKYTGPFNVSTPCTIRAVAAYHLNGGRGTELTYKVATPPAQPAAIHMNSGVMTFTGVAAGEVVTYTLNGSDPTKGGTDYAGPVTVQPDTQIAFYTRGANRIPTGVTRMYYSARGNLFADVKPGDWFCSPIDEITSLGFLKGVGGYRFDPGGTLTRGMVVTIQYRMSGDPVPAGRTNPFTDVKSSDYFAEAVEWAYRNGVVKGVSDTAFAPNRPVTRQELAGLMVRYYEVKTGEAVTPEPGAEQKFRDWDAVADWAKESAAAAVALGLMQGEAVDRFVPTGTASRAQGAAVLQRLLAALKSYTPPEEPPVEDPAEQEPAAEPPTEE